MAGSVAFDATPLAVPADHVGGHTLRGIGRYVGGLLEALVTERPEWAREHLWPVVTAAGTTAVAASSLMTRRAPLRSQDLGWLIGWLADSVAVRRSRPSLWHALDPNLPLSPLPESRTIRTCYDLIPLHDPATQATIRRHRRPIYGVYLRRLRTSRLVIAISETTARDLAATLGVARDRIKVVYPCVRIAREPAEPADHPRQPDLLFVGVPDPAKQAELAISALAECRRREYDVRLRFAGYHRPSDAERLGRLTEKAGVAQHVEFLGRVDEARLAELYRSHVLLAMSRLEGFGLPPVEALLAGGRVVAASAPVYREVLSGHADFAARDDARAVVDAYEAASARPRTDPPAELAARFSPRATADALVAAYEDVL